MFDTTAAGRAREALQKLEEAHDMPVTIETIVSLEGGSLREAAEQRVAAALGSRGLYLLIVQQDQRMTLLVPSECAGDVPEDARTAICGAFTGPFRRGEFGAGLDAGIAAIGQVLRGPARERREIEPAKDPGVAMIAQALPGPAPEQRELEPAQDLPKAPPSSGGEESPASDPALVAFAMAAAVAIAIGVTLYSRWNQNQPRTSSRTGRPVQPGARRVTAVRPNTRRLPRPGSDLD